MLKKRINLYVYPQKKVVTPIVHSRVELGCKRNGRGLCCVKDSKQKEKRACCVLRATIVPKERKRKRQREGKETGRWTASTNNSVCVCISYATDPDNMRGGSREEEGKSSKRKKTRMCV